MLPSVCFLCGKPVPANEMNAYRGHEKCANEFLDARSGDKYQSKNKDSSLYITQPSHDGISTPAGRSLRCPRLPKIMKKPKSSHQEAMASENQS